jgi:hypothetical protein
LSDRNLQKYLVQLILLGILKIDDKWTMQDGWKGEPAAVGMSG